MHAKYIISTLRAKFFIMKNVLSIILILIAMGCTQQVTFTYPETAKGEVVDDYHGTEVPIPTGGWKMICPMKLLPG